MGLALVDNCDMDHIRKIDHPIKVKANSSYTQVSVYHKFLISMVSTFNNPIKTILYMWMKPEK